jgi:ribosomal protein S18 acetylase RimI-like enzyme
MQAPSTTLVLPLFARRYVAWTERNLAQQCVELRIDGLQEWAGQREGVAGVEMVPLPECGSEWLLRDLFNECCHDSAGYRRAGYIHILAFRAAPYHDPHGILVARSEGRHVGFCFARSRPHGRGLINGLAVHPEFRGRGMGRALLRTSLLYLKGKKASEAVIRVHPDNAVALDFYRREGFLRT